MNELLIVTLISNNTLKLVSACRHISKFTVPPFVVVGLLESVCEVAVSATATPSWFASNGQFMDGSILANNPIDYALTYLQGHHYLLRQHFPVSLIVSLGAGVYRSEKLLGIEPPSPSKCKESVHGIQNLSLIMKQSVRNTNTSV